IIAVCKRCKANLATLSKREPDLVDNDGDNSDDVNELDDDDDESDEDQEVIIAAKHLVLERKVEEECSFVVSDLTRSLCALTTVDNTVDSVHLTANTGSSSEEAVCDSRIARRRKLNAFLEECNVMPLNQKPMLPLEEASE
ncbi:hypothetical protein AWC38_SpisGene24407, partial [Stylophora pistillata]